jgi:hypothetical protein
MISRPTVEPLARSHRRHIFWLCLVIFCIALPALWFYTTGYRFEWNGKDHTIVGVGGLYISTDMANPHFFVDEVEITNFRLFRKASYIQNLIEGKHSVHVQGDGVQTWTKDLPINSYIVTEAFSFNLPVIPRVRPITPYTTSTGTAVFQVQSTSSLPFRNATTTVPFIATTSKATTTLIADTEYTFVKSLFASTTASTTLAQKIVKSVEQGLRNGEVATTSATTTKEWRNVRLYEGDGEVYATWLGSADKIPYYYCVDVVHATTTTAEYGTHVYEGLVDTAMRAGSTTRSVVLAALEGQHACRDRIRIDRKWQQVHWFDFYPNSTDLVLMLLDDGLYVVEIDDRAWQNTQKLYGGTDLKVVLDGGRIYVNDHGYYGEVFTSLTQ